MRTVLRLPAMAYGTGGSAKEDIRDVEPTAPRSAGASRGVPPGVWLLAACAAGLVVALSRSSSAPVVGTEVLAASESAVSGNAFSIHSWNEYRYLQNKTDEYPYLYGIDDAVLVEPHKNHTFEIRSPNPELAYEWVIADSVGETRYVGVLSRAALCFFVKKDAIRIASLSLSSKKKKKTQGKEREERGERTARARLRSGLDRGDGVLFRDEGADGDAVGGVVVLFSDVHVVLQVRATRVADADGVGSQRLSRRRADAVGDFDCGGSRTVRRAVPRHLLAGHHSQRPRGESVLRLHPRRVPAPGATRRARLRIPLGL